MVDDEITFSRAPPSRILFIARTLKNKGFAVEVLGRKGDDVKGLKTTQKGGAKHVARLRILLSAYRKALSNSYKHIIIRGTLLAFPLLPLKALGKRIILDFHGWLFKEIQLYYEKNVYNKLKVVLYYFLERAATKYSNLIICSSKGAQFLLGKREKTRSIILENGLDINEAKKAMHEAEHKNTEIYEKYSIPKNKLLIGFMSNWGRHLDMEVMFKAAKIAGVSMIAIGEGPKLNEFEKKWNNITFTHKLPRQEALKTICLSDITIVPYKQTSTHKSYYSTRKVKDYLSLGKPIIMAEVKGRETYLIPNKNVLLYRPGDADDLADKIRKLLSDKKLQERMKTNNIKLSHRFDWKTLVEESGIIQLIK